MPNVAVHQISFRGTAGAIFVVLAFALGIYILGFATTGWSARPNGFQEGLWMSCQSTSIHAVQGT